MVPNPDPKQYLNNGKNNVIVFCYQSGETLRAAPTQLPKINRQLLCQIILRDEWDNKITYFCAELRNQEYVKIKEYLPC